MERGISVSLEVGFINLPILLSMRINYFGIGLNAHMINKRVAGPEEKKIDKMLLLINQSKIHVARTRPFDNYIEVCWINRMIV